ncbi:MAG: histidine phosphotransferase family protein [Pseudomonadota bacterium]
MSQSHPAHGATQNDDASAAPTDMEPLDALALSALLSSRVCHDLINPVGAIGSGLEVLDDASMDASMHEAAMDLVRTGAQKAIALLSYARLAYGAAGGYGAEISLEDAQKALTGVYDAAKADLDWRLGAGYAAKENVKVLLILGYAAADCVPRGGEVLVSGEPAAFEIVARGKKVLLNDDFVRALGGDVHEIMPKYAPAHIASRLVADAGGKISARLEDDVVTFSATFPAR